MKIDVKENEVLEFTVSYRNAGTEKGAPISDIVKIEIAPHLLVKAIDEYYVKHCDKISKRDLKITFKKPSEAGETGAGSAGQAGYPASAGASATKSTTSPWNLPAPKEYIPMQKCPLCDGEGVVKKNLGTVTEEKFYKKCPVCEGKLIIPMHEKES